MKTAFAFTAVAYIAANLGVYAYFLPGDQQWCWDAATGPVVGYELEVRYDDGFSRFYSFPMPETCATVSHPYAGNSTVHVRAFGANDDFGEWSEPSETYAVRGRVDCNLDGQISLADFNCFRSVFGLCLDAVGYRDCGPQTLPPEPEP